MQCVNELRQYRKENTKCFFLLDEMNVKDILIPKSDFRKLKKIILNIGGVNTLNIEEDWLNYIYYDQIDNNDNINFTKYFFDKLLIQLAKYMEFRLEFHYKDEYLTQCINTKKEYINVENKIIETHYEYDYDSYRDYWEESIISSKKTLKDYLTQNEFNLCTCKRENGIRICDCIEFDFSYSYMVYQGETPRVQINYTIEYENECNRILNEIEFIENDLSLIKTEEYCVKKYYYNLDNNLQRWMKKQNIYDYHFKQPILLSENPGINRIIKIQGDLAIFQNRLRYNNHMCGINYSF